MVYVEPRQGQLWLLIVLNAKGCSKSAIGDCGVLILGTECVRYVTAPLLEGLLNLFSHLSHNLL